MANIQKYSIIFYGGPDGYQTNRVQISLIDGPKTVGIIRFNDPEMYFEEDTLVHGVVLMHLPTSMLQSVLDTLRNEKPVGVIFNAGRGFLYTGSEPIGEGE
jgi:hypothetical protein